MLIESIATLLVLKTLITGFLIFFMILGSEIYTRVQVEKALIKVLESKKTTSNNLNLQKAISRGLPWITILKSNLNINYGPGQRASAKATLTWCLQMNICWYQKMLTLELTERRLQALRL